jgi:hypothetical protein
VSQQGGDTINQKFGQSSQTTTYLIRFNEREKANSCGFPVCLACLESEAAKVSTRTATNNTHQLFVLEPATSCMAPLTIFVRENPAPPRKLKSCCFTVAVIAVAAALATLEVVVAAAGLALNSGEFIAGLLLRLRASRRVEAKD